MELLAFNTDNTDVVRYFTTQKTMKRLDKCDNDKKIL